MKHGIQIKIASSVNISGPYLSEIINRKKRPSWDVLKRLVAAVPGSTYEDWMDAPTETLRKIISDYAQDKAA